ncbi:MAG TPA: hypothetical protein VKU83_07885, partial [Puia sp.]|nr:hypothetical protein [Puia sp.]
MFQKLYQHLEQINANTRRQQADLEHAEVWAAKISQQLDLLNASILALKTQPPRRRAPATGFVLGGLAVLLLGMLAIYAYQLSAVADAVRDRSAATVRAYGV